MVATRINGEPVFHNVRGKKMFKTLDRVFSKQFNEEFTVEEDYGAVGVKCWRDSPARSPYVLLDHDDLTLVETTHALTTGEKLARIKKILE